MTGPDLERLLADDAWLRRLARRLAGDAATADDLVQETWVAALAAQPAGVPRRPWLAGALRNRWRMHARGDARRAARERDAAPRELGAPPDEVAQELVLRRGVVDALLALGEPDRGVVFRRFYKDASLAAIAAADGVAVSTVHGRLERGLERMRARLDAAHARRGGRAAWSLGLQRIAELGSGANGGSGIGGGPAGATQTTWLGGVLMTTAMVKVAAVILGVGVAGLWWQGRGGSGASAGGAAGSVEVPDAAGRPLAAPPIELAGGGGQVSQVGAVGERRAATSRPPEPEASPATPALVHRGRLADLSGAPLAGVTVRLLARPAAVPGFESLDGADLGGAHGGAPGGEPGGVHPAETGGAGHSRAPGGGRGSATDGSVETDAGPPAAPAGVHAPEPVAWSPGAGGTGYGGAELGIAVTEADGGFAIALPAGVVERGAVPGWPGASMPRGYALDDARWCLVLATLDLDGVPLLLAAPRVTFAGVVLAPDGAPLPDVEVQLIVRETLLRSHGIPFAIDLRLPAWSTRTDDAGRFRLADVVGGEHAILRVPPGLYVSRAYRLPVHDDLDVVLRLRSRDDVLAVRGVVLDAAGRPVPGAEVAVGREIEETDTEGRFELAWDPEHERRFAEVLAQGMHPRPGPQSHVAAWAPGLGAARVELTRELVRDPVVLRLGGAPLAIDGRVVDGAGAPLAAAQVWMSDLTHFGTRRDGAGETMSLSLVSLEELRSGGRSAVTGADGRFRLDGLADRAYTLQAFDPRTSSFGPGWTVTAGTSGVELRLPVEPSATRVAGRIVSRGGKALGGVQVTPMRRLGGPELERPPRPDMGVYTDAEGRFAFPELAVEDSELLVFGGPPLRYLAERFPLAGFPDLAQIEIVLPLTGELQVVLLAASEASAVRVLDAAGNSLELLEHRGNFTMVRDSAEIVDGRSSVLSVSELAHEVVLLRDGEEVVRLPLRIDPDRRTVVEY